MFPSIILYITTPVLLGYGIPHRTFPVIIHHEMSVVIHHVIYAIYIFLHPVMSVHCAVFVTLNVVLLIMVHIMLYVNPSNNVYHGVKFFVKSAMYCCI